MKPIDQLTWPAPQTAKLMDMTPRHLARLVSDGVVPRLERGRYNPIAANVAYIRHLRKAAKAPDMSQTEFYQTKLAKMRTEKAEIELKMEIQRGKRIPIEDALESCNRVFQSIAGTLKANRDKILTEKHINEMLGDLRAACKKVGSNNGRRPLEKDI